MIKVLRYVLLTLFLSIVAILSGCGIFSSSSNSSQTVTVGALLPLTGSMANTGNGMKAAIKAGLEDTNRHLKVSGSKIRINVEYADTGTDPDTALTRLKEFYSEGIRLVIGPGSSSEAAAVLDYANTHGILLISSSTAPSLAIAGDNLLRLAPSDTNQAKGLAMLMNQQGIKHIITVNLNDNYGNELSAAVRQEFTSLGGTVDSSSIYQPNTTNYSNLISTLVPLVNSAASAYGADKVAIQLSSLEEARDIFKVAKGTSLESVKWYGSDGNSQHSYILADSDAASFAAAVSFTSPTFTVDETSLGMPKKVLPDRSLRQRIYSLYGGVTDTTSLIGYDAVWLIGLGLLDKGKDATAKDVISDIFSVTTDTEPGLAGASGRLELTSSGDKEDSGYSFYAVTSTTQSEIKYAYTFSGVTPQIITVTSSDMSLPSVAGGDINIGVLVPETGSLSQAGMSALRGIEEAASSLNSFYKFYGSDNTVKLTIKDTATDPNTAVEALKSMHDSGITLVTGVISSSVAQALLPYLNSYGMTLISPASTANGLAIADDGLYRFMLSDDSMAKAIAMLLQQDGKTRVSMIYRNDTWGTGLAADVATYLAGYGVAVTSSVPYDPTSSASYTSAVDTTETALASSVTSYGASANAVLLLSYEEGTPILSYASGKTAMNQVAWYGGDGYAKNTSLFSSAKAAKFAADRGLTCALYSILEVGSKTVPDPISRQVVVDRIKEKLGYEPITYAYTAWDSLWIGTLAYAEHAADSSSTLGTQITTQSAKYIGLSNYMALNAYGDRRYGEYGFFKVTSDKKWELNATYHYTPIDYSTPAITRP